MQKRQSRTLVFLAFALAAIVASILLRPRLPSRFHAAVAEPPAPTPEPPAAPASSSRSAPAAVTTARAVAPRPAEPAPEPAPVVDEVTVEKPEVCSGEENLVTVRAHTVNGTDEFLHYVVDGAMGVAVPLRLFLGQDGSVEGQHFVSVFGRGNVAVTVPVPAYTVKDCQPAQVVAVESHVQPNTWGDFDFVARVFALPPPGPGIRTEGSPRAFKPVSYAWSFGDGEHAITAGPAVTHDYERRAQDVLYSYFTIRVDARDADGQVLSGRTTLPLINPAFEAFAQKGVVQLLIGLDPRFPRLGPDGRVVQNVRLWHTRDQPVTIDAVTLTRYFEGASGETQPESVDPVGLLGTATVPPGKDGISTSVVLDTITDPGVFSMTYRLTGRSRDGHPVMGSFSVMRPPPQPTADNSQRIVDPTLKAKIIAAREMLGKDTVDDEDLRRLEQQGRFADIEASNASSPAEETGLAAAPAPTGPQPRPPVMPDNGLPSRGPPVPTGVTPPPAATMAPDTPVEGVRVPAAK